MSCFARGKPEILLLLNINTVIIRPLNVSVRNTQHISVIFYFIEWPLLPVAFHRNFKYEHHSGCYLYIGKLYVRLKFLQGNLFKTQLSLKAGLPQ